MKVTVAILSDIHLTTAESHIFAKRLDLIIDAIASVDPNTTGFLIVFSGDLANKGQREEFAAMRLLVDRIVFGLKSLFSNATVHVVSVPGNHDLTHPKDSEDYRRSLVESSLSTLRETEPNGIFLERLLEPLTEYQHFSELIDNPSVDTHSRIAATLDLTFGDRTLRLNLLNSSLLSQIHEKQGGLQLPMNLLRSKLLENQSAPYLTITVMHHPLFWIEANTLIELREMFGRTSDYVVTGHMHHSSGYKESSELGPDIKYYESPAIYDPEHPTSSAFRVLVLDLEHDAEKQFVFRWKEGRYVNDNAYETNFKWDPLVRNRFLRPSLTMNATAVEGFLDPGFAYISQFRPKANQLDLFVYPDLYDNERGVGRQTRIIRGREVVDYLSAPGITILQGSPLSGKTALSKRLVVDVRARARAIPVWLDGSTLVISSIEDLYDAVCKAFRNQYSKSQLAKFEELSPSERTVIIDDWHLARVPKALRGEIYEWFSTFTGITLLFVDQVYQVREALSMETTPSGLTNVVRKRKRVIIGGLSNVAKATLIHKWLASRKDEQTVRTEESREAKSVEDLITSMLGKDGLPTYAFYVLCLLQALESKKTTALAGGSIGPLFEILVYSALEKAKSNDLDISLKVVFLQELAYEMWTKKVSSLSRRNIDGVIGAYTSRNYLALPVSDFLREISDAKVLTASDGNYFFLYPQYFYYFIARYLRDHLEDEGRSDLIETVNYMIDHISSAENSTIVMCLIYFEKEKHRIIDRLVRNAKEIYSTVEAANLDEDAAIFSSRATLEPPPIIENGDVAANREAEREKKDAEEALTAPDQSAETALARTEYAYSEELSDTQKMHLATQSIQALGQVIRSFSANLKGPRKVEVIRTTYELALRTLGRVMRTFGDVIQASQQIANDDDSPVSLVVLRTLTINLFASIAQLYAIYTCNAVSSSIGLSGMEIAYDATLQNMEKTVAVRLIALTVQLNYSEAFPEQTIVDLHNDVKANKFSLAVLQWLVATYIVLNKIDPRAVRRMSRLFQLDEQKLKEAREAS